MYSQRDEEKFIVEHFGDFVGRFLEVGAQDGRNASNTLRLIELGWSGVMVEPAPIFFLRLLDNHGNNPKLTLVNCALGEIDDFRVFHYTEYGGVSTFDDGCRDNWKETCGDYRDYVAPVIAADRFIKSFPGPYDFVSIDAEGLDPDIVGAMPFDGVRLACIETSKNAEYIIARMAENNFDPAHRTDENIIFQRA